MSCMLHLPANLHRFLLFPPPLILPPQSCPAPNFVHLELYAELAANMEPSELLAMHEALHPDPNRL